MRPAFNSSKASWTLGCSESEGFLNDMTIFLLCCVFAVDFFLSVYANAALCHTEMTRMVQKVRPVPSVAGRAALGLARERETAVLVFFWICGLISCFTPLGSVPCRDI